MALENKLGITESAELARESASVKQGQSNCMRKESLMMK